MTDPERSQRQTWKIGELARAAGLTVRTLHHYDEVGLLTPSERSPAGHRVYDRDDVRRLYRIVALRQMGFPLADIRSALSLDGELDPRALVGRHLQRVEQLIADQRQLRDRLAGVLRVLQRDEQPATGDFLSLIEGTVMIEQYYTAEQLDRLAQRREALGDEAIAAVEREWAELYSRAERLLDEDRDPADGEVQALLDRMDELIGAFHGGDEGIKATLRQLWAEQGDALREQYGPPPRVHEYLQRARAARH